MSAPTQARRSLPATALVLVTAAVVASCSSSGSGSASSGTTSSSSSSASATPNRSATRTPAKRATHAAPTQAPVPVESNPPGDIPDNLAFVRYANRPGHFSFTHPEGWARTGAGRHVRFTDKLNGVEVVSLSTGRTPTVRSARSGDVPRLKGSVPAFTLRGISAVRLPSGRGVHVVYRRNSAPDPVTGKVYRDEVEEYDVSAHGTLVRMSLFGPVGADNVDAYRSMSQSLRLG